MEQSSRIDQGTGNLDNIPPGEQPGILLSNTSTEPFPIVGETLEVDHDSELDSALGESDRGSIATSLASSVKQFRVENGRRYHAFDENAYALPNDDIEIGRLDIQHHVWQLCLGGKLHLAPIQPDCKHVLDIGTGTGQWAIEFADSHPETQVLGTDLSPIQPEWTPPNCSFLIDNAEDEWVFNNKFDYIHSRMLMFGMHDWKRFFQQAWDNLAPGGWLESYEPEFPLHSALSPEEYRKKPLWQWSNYIAEAGLKTGIDTRVTSRFKDMLEEQGFINVTLQPLQWPQGSWPKGQKEKSIGKWMQLNAIEFLAPIAKSWWTKHLNWKMEEVEAFLPSVEKDLLDERGCYYWQIHIFIAQKPEQAT